MPSSLLTEFISPVMPEYDIPLVFFAAVLYPPFPYPDRHGACSMEDSIAKGDGGPILKTGIVGLFLLLNAVVVFSAVNPWVTDWRAQGITVLVVEAAFLLLIGLPSVAYEVFWKKKTFRKSLSDSVEPIMGWLSYF